jgi:hypothetical protein
MKPNKFNQLVEEIQEFIGDHNRTNPHHLFEEDIIERFKTIYKKKHIKKALEEVM